MHAQFVKNSQVIGFQAPVAMSVGQMLLLPDNRVGVVTGTKAPEAGDLASAAVAGLFDVDKASGICLLAGQTVYWNTSASAASYAGNFPIGTATADAAASATKVRVDLNMHVVTLPGDDAPAAASTLGLGVAVGLDGGHVMEFDAVAEAAMAAVYSSAGLDIDAGPIMEALVKVQDNGDDAALDVNVGIASGTHATDFDSVSGQVAVHIDGNSLNLNAQSNDGTHSVVATDTTVDYAEGTEFLVQIDCRDKSDCKIYINGVRVLSGTTFDISAYTGDLLAIAHMEKTSNDTTGKVSVRGLRLRGGTLAA